MFWIDFGVLSLVERANLLSEYLQYWSQDEWTGKNPILDSQCSLCLPPAPSIFLHPTPEPIQWKSLETEECLQECVVTVVRYLDRNKWLIFVISLSSRLVYWMLTEPSVPRMMNVALGKRFTPVFFWVSHNIKDQLNWSHSIGAIHWIMDML